MRRRIVGTCVIATLAVIAAIAAPAAVAGAGSVHPGVQTFTNGGQCTANFVFSNGSSTYIGQAAHCAGLGGATETDGCSTQSLPIGTEVSIDGATKPGTLAYSSWRTMQAVGETDAAACAFNDFALVKVDPSDVASVDPSVPRFGGPTGVGEADTGATILAYGNSSLRLGIAQLSPKEGLVLLVDGGGWSRNVLTVTPGVPGDSGSGYMNERGEAVGVLSTLALLPLPLSNGVGDLSLELDYMRSHSSLTGVRLVEGTKPFKGDLLAAIVGRSITDGLSGSGLRDGLRGLFGGR